MLKPRIGITNSPTIRDDLPIQALNRVYVDAVVRAGGIPVILPVLDPVDADLMVQGLDGLLLSGGSDIDPSLYGAPRLSETDGVDRDRDEWEMGLVFAAIERGIPLLGVCRGAQVVNVAMGGTLMQHLPLVTDHSHRERERFAEPVHDIEVLPGSRLARVAGLHLAGVNSLHHQAVAEIGQELRVVAWAPDGVVEAIESDGPHRILGVQWHPELLPELAGHALLFDWLVSEAVQGPAQIVDVTGPEPLGGGLAVA